MSPSLVAVMAHPDDIEIHIAGTLILLRDRGWDVHFVTVCNGDCGSMEHGRKEIARIRAREAKAAASQLGATYDGLGVGDLRTTYCPEIKGMIVDIIRKYQADAVFTHPRSDYMMDHELTSMMTREACFAASAPNWPSTGKKKFKPTTHIPELYYADRTSQTDSDGRFVEMPIVVDISSVIEAKAALLACHASQRDWLAKQHGEDNYLNTMRDWARMRGKQAKVKYGEGLTQHLGHPFPYTSAVFDSLKGSVKRFAKATKH